MNLNEANQIIGITNDDTQESIKKKYHKLIMLAHPDKGGSTSDFIKINEAWSVINEPGPEPELEYGFNLADLFKNAFQFDSAFFGINNPIGNESAKKQKVIAVKITVKEYLLGTTKKIKIPVTEYCNCKKNICKNCIGFGYRGNNVCESCLGQCYTQNCEKCEVGIINKTQKFCVKIPKCNNSSIYIGDQKINLILNEPGYFIKDTKLYSEFKITLKESLIGFNHIFIDPLGQEHVVNNGNNKIIHENDGFIISLGNDKIECIVLIFKIIYPKSFSKEIQDQLSLIL